MPVFDYRIAVGHNVSLGSLVNIENISQIRLPPSSQIVNPFPIRRIALSGEVFGDGRIDLEWRWSSMPITALEYFVTTYVASSVSSAVTIYTRRLGSTYQRYNAYLERPVEGIDYEYTGFTAINVVVRFRGLVSI